MTKKISTIFFLLILSLAAFFRFFGVNWDQDQHLHPDERFLTMVTGAIEWPENIYEYLNTDLSPLNPHNINYPFFVYGTFPLFFTKWIAESVSQADYNGITIIGRRLSALFDLGTTILIFFIARLILQKTKNHKSKITALLPHITMFIYACLVLPIQLAHFYAVDTYLTFFITLSFFLLINLFSSNYSILNSIFLGLSLGLAVASKISAVYFVPIIGLGLLLILLKNKNFPKFLISCLLILISGYFTIRLAQPYLFTKPQLLTFTLNPKIIDNWKQLKSFDDPESYFPPSVQWVQTKPFLFPLKNMGLWGLGVPIAVISFYAILIQLTNIIFNIYSRKFKQFLNIQDIILNLSLIWIIILFVYQGSQFVKALRYFYPIYPFLAISSGWIIYKLLGSNRFYKFFLVFILLVFLIYPLAFVSIYSRPHTRIAASYWAYKNIPSGATLSTEVWDDSLPMSLPGYGTLREKYNYVEFPLYNHDTEEKWQQMNVKLQDTDYIFLTSNRLYGSIMTVPEKYPVTHRFYQSLFDGSLGFEKIAEFTSRPNLPLPFLNLCLTPPYARYGIVAKETQECPLPGISFVDDYSDETFTVYDHPKVIIFKKTRNIDYLNLLLNP